MYAYTLSRGNQRTFELIQILFVIRNHIFKRLLFQRCRIVRRLLPVPTVNRPDPCRRLFQTEEKD